MRKKLSSNMFVLLITLASLVPFVLLWWFISAMDGLGKPAF